MQQVNCKFLISLIACLAASIASAEPQTPSFKPISIPEHVYDGGWEHYVGGGVAAFDCDGDDLPELYAAGGSNPAQLFFNRSTEGGSLQFEPAIRNPLGLTSVIGAYPLDIDSDRRLDLIIIRVGSDVLMRGLGNCAFEPFKDLNFISGNAWSTAFSATWEAGNNLPTLVVGTYVDRDNPAGPFETCDDTLLYRPDGVRYATPNRLSPGYCALSMLFSDWSRSGRADLRISNDRHYYVRNGQEQMWTMGLEPRQYTEADGWIPYALWGMGIAARDISGDGHQDVYLTSMGDQKFQTFDPTTGGPTWRDVTYGFGTTAHRPYTGGDGRPSTGWHAAFGDVNNDGRDDIFVAKGNVEQMPDTAQKDPNNLMLQQSDGRFVEQGKHAGIASLHRGRGAALIDLNLDGRLDLAVVNRRAPMEIWQNVTETDGNWLMIHVEQGRSNSFAIGSYIEMKTKNKTYQRELTVGGGHAGGDAGYQHFGLGDAQVVEVRVIWPDGDASPWQTFTANQRVTVSR